MTSAPGKTITYDYDNRPSSINSTTFVYDYSGHRVKKNSTVYIGKLYECNGTSCTKYIFAGNNRIALRTPSNATYYYHTDHLGSSSVMSGGSGNSEGSYYYYPYGGTRISSGLSIRHKFTGQELDDETGLYYYGARYYDPALGRFVSADSVVQDFTDPQTLNRYSYCRNNPIILTDPSGNIFIIDDIIIAAATHVAAHAATIGTGAAIGAVLGGSSAAVTGGNILQGMAIGAVSGAVFAGVGGFVGSSTTSMLENSAQMCSQAFYNTGQIVGGIAGGAAAGATSASMMGSNIGQGALIGGVIGVASGINVIMDRISIAPAAESNGSATGNVSVRATRSLTVCEKEVLSPYIPEVDLNNAILHDGKVPLYTPKWAGGITRNNDIYFRPGQYNPGTPAGLAGLGHELVHVGQYRQGMTWLSYLWSTRNGYLNSVFEKPAFALENIIKYDLTEYVQGGGNLCDY